MRVTYTFQREILFNERNEGFDEFVGRARACTHACIHVRRYGTHAFMNACMPWDVQPCLCAWHLKDPVPLIKIVGHIVATTLNKLYDYVLSLKMAFDSRPYNLHSNSDATPFLPSLLGC